MDVIRGLLTTTYSCNPACIMRSVSLLNSGRCTAWCWLRAKASMSSVTWAATEGETCARMACPAASRRDFWAALLH